MVPALCSGPGKTGLAAFSRVGEQEWGPPSLSGVHPDRKGLDCSHSAELRPRWVEVGGPERNAGGHGHWGVIRGAPQRQAQSQKNRGGLRTFSPPGNQSKGSQTTNHLPETPDALTLCSCRLHLPWTAAHHCWVSGEGGRGSSKPGTGAAVGRASRPGSPRPWLPPLSEACRIWAQKGPCSVACSAGTPPSSACPRPAWAAGPGPAVPQDGEARAPGRAAWWTGPPGLLHAWPQERQHPSLGPCASVVCELPPMGTLLAQPRGVTCRLDPFPEPWARPWDSGRGSRGEPSGSRTL